MTCWRKTGGWCPDALPCLLNENIGSKGRKTVMGDPSDIGALTLAVGEMRGQMRELIHTNNNMAMKVEHLTEKVLLAQALPAEVARLADVLVTALARIDALEADKNRSDGAKGVLAAVMRSPVAAWGAAIIAGIWGAFKGGLLK